MKNVAAVLAVVLFTGSSAFAGVITFGTGDTIVIDRGVDPTNFSIDLTVTAQDAASFAGADVIVGSDNLAMTGFAWGFDPGGFATIDPPNSGFYASQIGFGFFQPGATNAAPFLLGTLQVETVGLVDGFYAININADLDSGRSALQISTGTEGLFGTAVVHIVPEPATLSLLALGAIGLISRRRKA